MCFGFSAKSYFNTCDRGLIGVCLYHNQVVEDTVDDGLRNLRVRNIGMSDYLVKAGDKIAQLLIIPVLQWEMRVVETLDNTVRGEGGFGSTGV